MAFSFTVDGHRGVVRFLAEGVFSSQDLMDSIKRVTADPAFRPDFDHLVDLRAVSAFQPDSDDIRKRTQHDRSSIRLDAGRIAIVASDDFVFGMSRMYETLMDGSNVTARTFRDMADAEAWLGLASGDGGSKD